MLPSCFQVQFANLPCLQCPHCSQCCYTTYGLTQHICSLHSHNEHLQPSPSSVPITTVNDLDVNEVLTDFADALWKAQASSKDEHSETSDVAVWHPGISVEHPFINGIFILSQSSQFWHLHFWFWHWIGQLYDEDRARLPPNFPPSPCIAQFPHDWFLYKDQIQLEATDLLFCETKILQSKLKYLLEIWAASILQETQGESTSASFDNHSDLFKIINTTSLSDVP